MHPLLIDYLHETSSVSLLGYCIKRKSLREQFIAVVSTSIRQSITATMKGILATLALLQLVVINEGFRVPLMKVPASRRISTKPEVIKSCPRNEKLEAMRKALGLTPKHRRQKRSVSKYLVL